MLSDEEDDTEHSEKVSNISQTTPDAEKLENLLKRRKVYGDIAQNASEKQIQRLLVSKIKKATTF